MTQEECKEKIVMLLSHGRMQQEDGARICELLGILYNCYGSYAELSGELYERLSIRGRKKFCSMLAFACLYLSWEWIGKGYTDWDMRKAAAESFCYKNRDFFEKLFKKNAGFRLETVEGEKYLVNALTGSCREAIRDSGRAYLFGFIHKWVNIHPTLQQSIVGGCVQGILMKDGNPSFAPPLDYAKVAFPFI